MIESKSFLSRLFDVINYLFLGILTILFLYPMWHVLMGSLSVPFELYTHSGLIFWPLGNFSLAGYKHVFSNVNLVVGYQNTIFYVVVGTLCNVLITILGAYVLSRRELALKKLYSLMVVFTMYFGGGLIPTFLVVKGLGLLDSRWALILPGLVGTWNMIVMRTSFKAIPPSLEESARIDGANDFTILFRIIAPVAKATIAVMILFYAVGHWNSWFNAAIYLTDRGKYPLQLFLREILLISTANNEFGDLEMGEALFLEKSIRYGMIIISTIPILCIYPFVQRYFMKGVMMGSIKE